MFKEYRRKRAIKLLQSQLDGAKTPHASQEAAPNYSQQQIYELEQKVQAICNHLGIWLTKPMGYEVKGTPQGLVGADAQTQNIALRKK